MKNNKKKKLLIVSVTVLVLIAILSQTYGTILKLIWEIREPRVENRHSLLQTANKYQLDAGTIVTTAPDAFSNLRKDFRAIPEVLIFDKSGKHIEYKVNDSSCNAGAFGFIASLDKHRHYDGTDKIVLSNEMKYLRDLNGNPLPDTYIDPNADFYVLISWAAFTGKLNKDHVHAWQELAAKNGLARIQTIAVNLDVQEWWPQQFRDSIDYVFAE